MPCNTSHLSCSTRFVLSNVSSTSPDPSPKFSSLEEKTVPNQNVDSADINYGQSVSDEFAECSIEGCRIARLLCRELKCELNKLKSALHSEVERNREIKLKLDDSLSANDILTRKVKEIEEKEVESGEPIDEKLKKLVGSSLTSNQIDLITKRKVRVKWTQEEISRAFTLRYLSRRSYVYLRESLSYPLPGLSTLRKWVSSLEMRSGFLEGVFSIVRTSGLTKTPFQKATVISFDEMKVSSVLEYDAKHDEIIGPHNYMQVVMARGLFDSWKQPVFVGFDRKMTKDLLLLVIHKLHAIDYCVVACVSDCGGGNMGRWKEFNITMEKTFTLHPVTLEKMFFSANTPHLEKLLRNDLFKTI